jgi:hypothetical protein
LVAYHAAALDWSTALLVCLPAGKDWSMDTDWEDAPVHVQRGYLAMLAIDSLLAFMGR